MQNPLKFFGSVADEPLLVLVGGELLDGSGFEAEQAEPTFASNEMPELPAEDA